MEKEMEKKNNNSSILTKISIQSFLVLHHIDKPKANPLSADAANYTRWYNSFYFLLKKSAMTILNLQLALSNDIFREKEGCLHESVFAKTQDKNTTPLIMH